MAWMSTNRFSTVFDIQYNGVVGIQARSRDTTCVCVCVFFVDRIEAVSVMGRLSFEIPGLLPPAPFFFSE